jgi:hypothetical protein
MPLRVVCAFHSPCHASTREGGLIRPTPLLIPCLALVTSHASHPCPAPRVVLPSHQYHQSDQSIRINDINVQYSPLPAWTQHTALPCATRMSLVGQDFNVYKAGEMRVFLQSSHVDQSTTNLKSCHIPHKHELSSSQEINRFDHAASVDPYFLCHLQSEETGT